MKALSEPAAFVHKLPFQAWFTYLKDERNPHHIWRRLVCWPNDATQEAPQDHWSMHSCILRYHTTRVRDGYELPLANCLSRVHVRHTHLSEYIVSCVVSLYCTFASLLKAYSLHNTVQQSRRIHCGSMFMSTYLCIPWVRPDHFEVWYCGPVEIIESYSVPCTNQVGYRLVYCVGSMAMWGYEGTKTK